MLQQSGRHSGWQISRLLWVVWLRLLHVISAMVYVGGHILENLLLYRFEASGGRMRVLKAIDAAEPAINVAAPIMIVTGVLMVATDDAWGFTSPFVLIGIGAILMSAIVGIPILREMRALEALIDDQGESDEVIGRYGRVSTAWTGLGLVYLVAVWAMIFKP